MEQLRNENASGSHQEYLKATGEARHYEPQRHDSAEKGEL